MTRWFWETEACLVGMAESVEKSGTRNEVHLVYTVRWWDDDDDSANTAQVRWTRDWALGTRG